MKLLFILCLLAMIFILAANCMAGEETKTRCLPLGIGQVPEEYRDKLPLPLGLTLIYLHNDETYLLQDASVTFNGIPIPSELLVVNSADAVTDTFTLRGDVWILPYLNLSAHAGTYSGTASNIDAYVVGMEIPIPDEISFNGTSYGLGGTVCGMYKSLILTYDWHINWSNTELLNENTRIIRQGPRVGIMFGEPDTLKFVYVGAVHERLLGRQSGSVAIDGMGQLDFDILAAPEGSWNYIFGVRSSLSKENNICLEYGFGRRKHVMFYFSNRH